MKLPSQILFVTCAIIASAAASPVLNSIPNLTTLSFPQKLAILASSVLKPSTHKNVTWNSLFSDDNMPWVDNFYVDLRSLLVQTIKVSEDPIYPEINWSYCFSLCWYGFCVDETISVSTSKTYMVGQKHITSVNTVTPTSFKNSFHVPHFVWHSPGFLFNITDNASFDNIQLLSRDLYLGIDNLSLNTTADYEFVPDLGIQIKNLTIDFSIGYMRVNLENNTVVYNDGQVDVYDPIKADHTEYLTSNWENGYKRNYEEKMEFRINCILSGAKNDPERCEQDGPYENRMYYKMNVLQLFETIGLASLDRY